MTTLSSPRRPWKKKHFQTAQPIPPCFIPPMFLKSLTFSNCSFNTAVSSTSFLADPFPEQHTVVPTSRSVFRINTSTPTETVTQRPLLTDALLNNASSRNTTLSPIRRAENNCPRLLHLNTVNQRHATAQHILNKQLQHEVQNELGLETTQTVGYSGQSIKTMQPTSQTVKCNRPIHRELHFCSFGKNKCPNTGRKLPADQTHTHTHTHTQKRVFHFIIINKTRFPNESDCLHFCTYTNQFIHLLVSTTTLCW